MKYLIITIFVFIFVSGTLAFSDDKLVEKDINGDGTIDQIAFFNTDGKIKRLEADHSL